MSHFSYFFTIVMLSICFGAHAQKQSAFVHHLTVSEGLSNNKCYAVLKDSKGYIWMGTENGLNRYDGHKFQVFRNIPNDTTSIGGNTVLELHEDEQGNIWISGVGFLDKYNLYDHRFTHIAASELNTRMHIGGFVEAFFTDRLNRTWLCVAGGGIELYHPEDQSFSRFFPAGKPGALLDNFVSGMCQSADGRYWLSTHNGLYELSADLQTFTPHRVGAPSVEEDGFYNLSTCILVDPLDANVLWYGTWGTGLHRYNMVTGETAVFKFRSGFPMNISNIVFDLQCDRLNNLWLSSEYGLAQFNRSTQTFTFIDDDVNNPHALINSEMRNIFVDDDNMLLTSGYRGVNILDPKLQLFSNQPFGNNAVLSNLTYDARRQLFVGATYYRDRRLNIYNPRTKSTRVVPLPFAEEGMHEPFGFYIDQKGHYWIGCVRANVRTFDPESGRFDELPLDRMLQCTTKEIDVRSFLEDKAGRIWMAALSFGVVVYEPEKGSAAVVTQRNETFNGALSQLRQDENYVYAFGENYGIVRINKATLQKEHARFSDYAMLKNAVDFELTPNGGLLITTNSHGLVECVFSPNGLQIVRTLNTTNGLPDNNLGSIVRFASNEYWMVCSNGLLVYRPDGVSHVYSENNGLYPFSSGVQLIVADGRVCYSSGDRMVSFYPPELNASAIQAKVVLNSFRVGEREVFTPDVLGDIQHIDLLPGQNAFAFEYSALCFSNANQLEYAFVLQGFDEDWHYVGDRLYASYSGLAPGDYELRIKSRMAESAWPDEFTRVHIHIPPLWWQTWWFRLAVLLVLVVATLASIRLYTRSKLRKVELELEKQKSIQQIRTRISRDIHDEIGAGLTKISLMSRKVVRESKGEAAAEAAQSIAGASQQLVKNLGEIVWTINPKNDTLADFLGYVRSYCTDLFEESGVKLVLNIDEISPQLRALRLYPEVKRNLLLIIKETLNNALKHSQATEVSVRMALRQQHLEIEIEDNGRGFDAKERGESGNGLRNMKKRSEEIGATYQLQSSSQGTRASISLLLDENLL